MSSQKPTAVELTTEAGEGEGEAKALSSSQLDKQEYVSFPRPRKSIISMPRPSRAAGQTSVAKKSGQQAPPSLKTLQRQVLILNYCLLVCFMVGAIFLCY